MIFNKKISYILIISVVLLVFFNISPCFAQEEDEERPFTEAEKLAPEKLDLRVDKSYDEALMIKHVEIKGNNLVSTEKILENIETKPGTKFDRTIVYEDLKKLYSTGYFTEKMRAVPETDSSGVTLYIEVEENVPVTGFTVSGNDSIKTEEILTVLKDQIGLPQNIMELNQSIQKVEELYSEKGYILAKVKKVQDDPDGCINIEIDEGIIDEIEISGNTKTKDFVIERNITMQPGDVYNEQKLRQDISRIFGLRAFSDVRRVISPSTNDPSKYNVTIEVDEKRTGSISLGGGIDTETGLFGQAGYVDTNLFGRGQELGLNFMIGSGAVIEDNSVLDEAPFSVELKFIEPRLRNTMNSLEIRGFGEHMASYQIPLGTERRIGGRVELARPIKRVPNLAGSVSMGVENIKVKEGDYDMIRSLFIAKNIDMEERARQLRGGTFVSLGPSLVYDSRNAIINPTDGWYATANFRESVAIGGDANSFGKIGASVRKYFPVGKKSTFTIAARAASTVFGDAPEVEAFRLGGPYTIRGFKEGDVGNGQGILLGSAEFRTPIPFLDKYMNYKILRDIRLALFMDAGKTIKGTITNDLYDYPERAITIGAGLIVPLPYLGPIRFDYGYPITAVIGGNKGGSFSFGIGDRY